ncbi:MAG TPA: PKD domain-containing protein [bacterium]|nr:PKD domain-containing protein [bacterium]
MVLWGSVLFVGVGCGAGTRGGGVPKNLQKPVANAGTDQTSVSTTQQVPLDGSQSYDPQGLPLTYSWSIQSAPSGSNAPLLNAATGHATIVPDKEGTYFVSLVVNDGYVDSDPATIQVSVTNSAPLAVVGSSPRSRTNCGGVTLDATQSSDPNGDALQYQWTLSQKPAGSNATIDNPTAPRTFYVPDVPGNYVAEVVVSDGKIGAPPASVATQVDGDVPHNGNVLVAQNASPYDVLAYDPNGAYLGKFIDGATVTASTSSWKNLYGVTQLKNGSVLVSAAVSQRVFKFSSAGTFQGEWSTAYTQGNLSVPQGMLEAPNGDILIATWKTLGVGRHAIQLFSSLGGWQFDFKNDTALNSPRNLILACNGEYLVTNSGAGSIDRFDSGYHYLGTLATGLAAPTGIAQLNDGSILVTSFTNSTVTRYGADGSYIGGFNGAGSGLSAPSSVVQLGNGNVVVSSTSNNKVKIYDSTGALLGDLGTNAPLASPIGVAQMQ